MQVLRRVHALLLFAALQSVCAQDAAPPPDSAALRATVFGPAAADLAPLPASVPLTEIDIALPWARPLPEVLWFNRRLRVWLSAQREPAPLVIVISGTGGDANTSKLSLLRAVLYGAGYHVLTMPSPTSAAFIAAASSTGVAGDLLQDGRDLYAAAQAVIARLPPTTRITDIHIVGYSLGGANAAVVKSIDAREQRLRIHRAVMINPPVSLFASVERLDRLFARSIGSSEDDVERLYRRLYVRLANSYRATEQTRLDDTDLFTAATAVLRSDADFAAGIALTFRLSLSNMFYVGDLYAGTGVVLDPRRAPRSSDPTEDIARRLRDQPFANYFERVFVPYYRKLHPEATRESLLAANHLAIIGDVLHGDGDYYAQTNADELILDRADLDWLRETLGERVIIYEHGGHAGNLGERRQVADLLDMLAGRWNGSRP